MMEDITWCGNAKKNISSFPPVAKREAGFELHNIQLGLEPSDWKPMRIIGPSVKEIRIHEQNEYRIIYVASLPRSVYVLHAFIKKTQKTSMHDIKLAKKYYYQIMRQVNQ